VFRCEAAATGVAVGHAGEVCLAGLWPASRRGPSHGVAAAWAVQAPSRPKWVVGHGAVLRPSASPRWADLDFATLEHKSMVGELDLANPKLKSKTTEFDLVLLKTNPPSTV
jgi:hypothetical protein